MLTVGDLVARAAPADAETRAALDAYTAGDRSAALAERLRGSFQALTQATCDRELTRGELVTGWALHAALGDISGDRRRLASTLRWAEADLEEKTPTWDPAVACAGR